MKKILNRFGILLVSVLMLAGGLMPVKAEGEDFDEFLDKEWRHMMESDYVSMHYSVKDYKKLGLQKPEVTIGEIGFKKVEKDLKEHNESLEKLHQFDYNALSDSQKIDYQVYEQNLKDSIADESYPYYMEMFNPYMGNYSNLTTTLTEFIFYTKEDIDDYLILADDYDRYMDDMMAFTKEQAAKGYFMTDAALDEQLKEMQEFIDKGEENPLIIIFNNNVDAFEGLSEEERNTYKEKNKDIVLNQILPSNQKIKDSLETLRGSRSVSGSLYNYPDGVEYYNTLVTKKTSSSGTIQEKFDYLTKSVKDAYNYYLDILLSDITGEEGEHITGFKDPEEILYYLKDHLEGFPKGPELTFKASYLDPSVANPSVMAYYLTTPIDDLTDNVIRVNGSSTNTDDMDTLYYTLSHEGFPGHLYQFTWYYSQDYNSIRHDLNMIGYTEGWAQYVEKIMLNRAPGISLGAQETVAMNAFLGYTVQAAADLAVNGLGYDKAAFAKWMKDLGFGDGTEESVADVYQSVIDMPGQILPYGYGMAKFWELRERTQAALEEEFDMEEYHLQILTNGPRSFDTVENDLKAYVESKGKTWPTSYTLFEHEKPEGTLGVGKIVSFVQNHIVLIIIVGIVIVALILWIIFLILRGLFRLIFGRGK